MFYLLYFLLFCFPILQFRNIGPELYKRKNKKIFDLNSNILEETIKKSIISKNVIFEGFVSETKKSKLLSPAKCDDGIFKEPVCKNFKYFKIQKDQTVDESTSGCKLEDNNNMPGEKYYYVLEGGTCDIKCKLKSKLNDLKLYEC